MNDPLEQFISKNREDFDKESPRLDVWAAIDSAIQPEKQEARVFSFKKFARMAAAVVLLLATGATIGIYSVNNAERNAGLSSVSVEMAELESFYKTELNRKLVRLASHSNFDDSVNDDLEQLEAVMQDLRKELAKHPGSDNEVIINAMIRNYKTRIEILETVSKRMEEIELKSNKTEKDDKQINI